MKRLLPVNLSKDVISHLPAVLKQFHNYCILNYCILTAEEHGLVAHAFRHG